MGVLDLRGRRAHRDPGARRPDGFLRRFLAAYGPGVHHITFKVPSLAGLCARAEALGYSIVGRDESDPSWKEAFLHPRQALGIVVQMAEAADTPAVSGPRPLPPGLPDAPPPVRILGLRMRVRSAERALTQWRDVLEARVEETREGGLVFRWPRSPMRIAVDLDPAAAEGPVAIELAGPTPAAPLEAAGVRLGIRLHPV